ncbi:MAG: hypothetical protein JJT96_15350 [Opitutales bacterium]|nr:hypothetical protein [Opitutales bacterium]
MDPAAAINRICDEEAIEEKDDDESERAVELVERCDRETPVSYGEIFEEDQRMVPPQIRAAELLQFTGPLPATGGKNGLAVRIRM